jgi:hypothetical protein
MHTRLHVESCYNLAPQSGTFLATILKRPGAVYKGPSAEKLAGPLILRG